MTGTTTAAESRLAMPGGEISLLRGGDGPPLLFLHGGGVREHVVAAARGAEPALRRRRARPPADGTVGRLRGVRGGRRPRPALRRPARRAGHPVGDGRRRVVRRLAGGGARRALAGARRAARAAGPDRAAAARPPGHRHLPHAPRAAASPRSSTTRRRGRPETNRRHRRVRARPTATCRRSRATRGSRSCPTRSSRAACTASGAARSWSRPARTASCPRAHAERYAERIAGARLEVVEDVGHALYVERPEAVADVVAVVPVRRGGALDEVQLLPPDALPVPAGRLRRALRVDVARLPERQLRPARSATGSTTATSTSSSTPSRLGFDGIAVNEHHQTAYGMMPSPNIMAAALARRTSRAKIMVLGNAIPIRGNPLRVAEEIAMLDHLTDGRLVSGFVRGIGWEYFAHAISPTRSRDALRRGPRPDHQGVDVDGAVPVDRRELRVPLREHLAAAAAGAAPADRTWPARAARRR